MRSLLRPNDSIWFALKLRCYDVNISGAFEDGRESRQQAYLE